MVASTRMGQCSCFCVLEGVLKLGVLLFMAPCPDDMCARVDLEVNVI